MQISITAKAIRVLLSAAAIVAATSGHADALDRTVVRIASEGAYAPWNATDPSGNLVGFEIDLGYELCKRMATQCEFVALDWESLIPALQNGRIDAIMATMSITAERERAISFAGPYANEPSTFCVPAGSALTATSFESERVDLSADGQRAAGTISKLAASLHGRTVGVQASTTQANFMAAHLPDVAIRAYTSVDQAALDLAAGRIDAILAARSTIDTIVRSHGFRVFGPPITGGPLGRGVGVGLRKSDTDLRSKFEQAISSATADGAIARLSHQHLGFDASVR
ncbi:octopine/nopaline transport system substrate-binding protein [Azospirillum sp. OGB3]|uniref:Solute-binding protein family 3/N-terminal domain-containing protein n=1 Tax=Azospirillum argentinense TaxID=2970906 RepID=A0A5B0KPJ4_9PROT|nr:MULTISPECIES: transporter substrate-binding domain-containing protein [Azospirillum]KAA1053821.1 Lysine-arginine-ornithine-binding periplasmic protein precursor [Azospirillum argentinense]MBB3267788.1 octopine/nopaline transport system substrate-binding protein [Azospirillum sp. OGB3]